MTNSKDVERFFRNVIKKKKCWEWIGGVSNAGYGCINIRGKIEGAHRFSYIIHKGKVPKKMYVCHTCDNKLCVNPKHLWIGTPRENQQDMYDKGRDYHVGFKGEENPRAKLDRKSVKKIIKMYLKIKSQRKLAKQFGVCKSTIGYILRGEVWT